MTFETETVPAPPVTIMTKKSTMPTTAHTTDSAAPSEGQGRRVCRSPQPLRREPSPRARAGRRAGCPRRVQHPKPVAPGEGREVEAVRWQAVFLPEHERRHEEVAHSEERVAFGVQQPRQRGADGAPAART